MPGKDNSHASIQRASILTFIEVIDGIQQTLEEADYPVLLGASIAGGALSSKSWIVTTVHAAVRDGGLAPAALRAAIANEFAPTWGAAPRHM